MARMGLEARLEELQRTVAALEEIPEAPPTASAALFFGGGPVVGTRGIESEFAGQAIGKFQDIVSKVLAHETSGLGQRGVVPHKAASTLHITNNRARLLWISARRGTARRIGHVTMTLSAAVDEATRLLDAFGELDEEQFRSAAESMDERLLATTRDFFGLMRQSGATFRLVAGDTDRSFGTQAIIRAADRASSTEVEETEEVIAGRLTGVLPESHMFEFRASDSQDVIRGRIHRSLTTERLATFNRTMTNIDVRARLRIKRVRRSGAVVRENFMLMALDTVEPQLLRGPS